MSDWNQLFEAVGRIFRSHEPESLPDLLERLRSVKSNQNTAIVVKKYARRLGRELENSPREELRKILITCLENISKPDSQQLNGPFMARDKTLRETYSTLVDLATRHSITMPDYTKRLDNASREDRKRMDQYWAAPETSDLDGLEPPPSVFGKGSSQESSSSLTTPYKPLSELPTADPINAEVTVPKDVQSSLTQERSPTVKANANHRPKKSIKALCLDGGGVRGITQLTILEELMNRIKFDKDLLKDPRPCDYFDIMAGTGTGGLIALLLGRLGLTASQAIDAYIYICRRVYDKANRIEEGDDKGKLNAQVFESVVQDLVKQQEDGNSQALMNASSSTAGNQCKVFVCAQPGSHITKPRLFRTYAVRDNASYNCAIWEAARATSASPLLFPEIKIGPLEESFVDGGLGCNNPIHELLDEIPGAFPFADPELSCVISLGSGKAAVMSISNVASQDQEGFSAEFVKVLQGIAADCEMANQKAEKKFKETKVFHRFNVEQGMNGKLDEWNDMAQAVAHTHAYTVDVKVTAEIDEVVNLLANSSE